MGCVCCGGGGGGWRFLLKLVNAPLNNRPLAGPAGLRSPSPGPTRCAHTQFSRNSTCPMEVKAACWSPELDRPGRTKKSNGPPIPPRKTQAGGRDFHPGWVPPAGRRDFHPGWLPPAGRPARRGPHAAEARVHFKANDTFLSDFPGLHLLETRGSGFWDPSSF